MYTRGMDLLAYVRVSSEGQTDGYGPDSQLASIRGWAKANGHKIVAVHQDAVSGTKGLSERPGLSAAIKALLPPPEATGIVFARMDRLARDLEIQEKILSVIWLAGGTVFTAEGGLVDQDNPMDPQRKFFRQIQGAMSELDKGNLVKKLRQAREAKAASGKKSVGEYAYGYMGAGSGRNRDAVERSDEQETVRRIMELRQAGESYRSIAATLDSEGRKPRRSTQWHAPAIRNIVERAKATK